MLSKSLAAKPTPAAEVLSLIALAMLYIPAQVFGATHAIPASSTKPQLMNKAFVEKACGNPQVFPPSVTVLRIPG